MIDKKQFAAAVLHRQGTKRLEHETILEDDFSTGWEDLLQADPPKEDTAEGNIRHENEDDLWPDYSPERSWRRPVSRKALEQKFKDAYTDYVLPQVSRSAYSEQFVLDDLLRLLSELCTYVIYDRIRNLSVYHSGDEEEITQLAHVEAADKLKEDRIAGKERPGALYYYVSIYKYKTVDYLRHYGLWSSRSDPEQESVQKRTRTGLKKSELANSVSIERMATNEKGEIMLDRFEKLSVNPFRDEHKLRASGCRDLMMVYLRELLDYRNKPAGALAVMYARILYQLERTEDPDLIDEQVDAYMTKKGWRNDPADERYDEHLVLATEEVLHYTTSTNPRWAVKRMGLNTIDALLDDSEDSLDAHFSADLVWSAIVRQSTTLPAFEDGTITYGELVYTHEFSQKRIERWATDVHNATIKRAVPLVRSNKPLLAFVLEEVDSSNQLKKELQKQMEKEVSTI